MRYDKGVLFWDKRKIYDSSNFFPCCLLLWLINVIACLHSLSPTPYHCAIIEIFNIGRQFIDLFTNTLSPHTARSCKRRDKRKLKFFLLFFFFFAFCRSNERGVGKFVRERRKKSYICWNKNRRERMAKIEK